MISGKPVISLTSVTGIPAAARVFAVEPVDNISTPESFSTFPISSKRLLS